jgi:hypothetical protein
VVEADVGIVIVDTVGDRDDGGCAELIEGSDVEILVESGESSTRVVFSESN